MGSYPRHVNYVIDPCLLRVIGEDNWGMSVTSRGDNVFHLYTRNDALVASQIRYSHTDNVDEKYSLTKEIYKSCYPLKTDSEDIPGPVVICEGTKDCWILREHGVNAYTVLGCDFSRFGDALDKMPGKKFFVTDNDYIGHRTATQLSEIGYEYLGFSHQYKDIFEMYTKDRVEFDYYIDNIAEIARVLENVEVSNV